MAETAGLPREPAVSHEALTALSHTKLPVLLDLVALMVGLALRGWWTRRALTLVGLIGLAVMGIVAGKFIAHSQYAAFASHGGAIGSVLFAGIADLMNRSDNVDTALRVFAYTPSAIPYWGSQIPSFAGKGWQAGSFASRGSMGGGGIDREVAAGQV